MRRWLLFLLLALSCAKQDPVHQTIEDLADAAEERDSGAVLEHLAAEFPDRAEVENQLRRYFFAYKTIDVTVRDIQVERSGSTAWATFRVDFIGLPKSVGGFDQYLPRSAKYRFELNLADKGGEWQVTGGRWEEVR